jgi:hypothetical protein
MVEAGSDINAAVESGAYKGKTCYDLAKTEILRNFIRDLGGNPSKGSVPEYSLEIPHIPKPKVEVRRRKELDEQQMAEIMHDARRSLVFLKVVTVAGSRQHLLTCPTT